MSYAFTDTHCHFDFPPFTGHEGESLVRAASAGVTRIIVPTVTADRFARVLRLAQDHAPLFAALGLHPLYIAQHHGPQLEQLAALLAEPDNLQAAFAAAQAGADRTCQSSKAGAGRASYLNSESLLGNMDPGAHAVAMVFKALAER